MHPLYPFGKDVIVVKVLDVADSLKVGYVPQVFENVGSFLGVNSKGVHGVVDLCQPNYFFLKAGLYILKLCMLF